MEMDDFNLMSKGFWAKKKYEQHLLRRVAYITHASMVSKPLSPDRIWPIDVESKKVSKEQLKARSENIIKRLAMMQKIDDEKKKHGRRT